MKTTLTEENYLKALFHLGYEGKTVSVNEMAKFLDVKMPTVNNMMKKFSDKKWIIYEPYKPIMITEMGMKEAALIVRKHRLTEMFLVEKMNFGWENVHEIAEQLEHVHSNLFFEKMDEILNFPKFDPHGEPIPDKEGNIYSRDLCKLSVCNEGERVIFKAVTFSDNGFLTYLNDRNIVLGQTMAIEKIESFDQSFHIFINSKKEILSNVAAERILVSKK